MQQEKTGDKMETTYKLYRSDSKRWKDLTYTKALEERIKAAKEAMNYYRSTANINRFINSEKAKNFNQKLLEECNEVEH